MKLAQLKRAEKKVQIAIDKLIELREILPEIKTSQEAEESIKSRLEDALDKLREVEYKILNP